MASSYILLGSNLGNKLFHLNKSLQLLIASGMRPGQMSKIYQTKAWGNQNQDDFYNVVLKIETASIDAVFLYVSFYFLFNNFGTCVLQKTIIY